MTETTFFHIRGQTRPYYPYQMSGFLPDLSEWTFACPSPQEPYLGALVFFVIVFIAGCLIHLVVEASIRLGCLTRAVDDEDYEDQKLLGQLPRHLILFAVIYVCALASCLIAG